MSETVVERSVAVAAPAGTIAGLVADGGALFRLNPEWEVLAVEPGRLRVRYERSEQMADYRVVCRPRADGVSIGLDGEPARNIDLSWSQTADGRQLIVCREAFAAPPEAARLAELTLWWQAFGGYLAMVARPGRWARVVCWLVDRLWLRMTPTARRVSLLIVGMEALALLLLVAVLLVLRLAG